MAIFDRVIDSMFTRYFKQREDNMRQNIGSEFYQSILKAIGTGNPIYMNDNVDSYIKNGYLFNPTVYSIISFIAQKASTIPWGVYSVKDQKALQLFKSGSPDITVNKMLIRRKALEEIKDHELSQLFITPNPLQGWADYFEQVCGFKLVTGNSYTQAIAPSAGVNQGKIKELWCLASQDIEIIAGDKTEPVKEYRMISDKRVVFTPSEIIHLKYWTPEYIGGSMLYGLSPIKAGRRVVTKSNASFDVSTSAFQNSGVLGLLTANNAPNMPGLTTEQAQAIEEKLKQRSGHKSQNRWIATSADLKWQQMGMSPADLAIIESDKMDLRTLCNIYHVPSELFNDAANKTYSNTKEAARAVWVNAVIPMLTQFRDSFNNFIRGRYESNIYIDYDLSVVQELQDDLNTMVGQLQNAWWITPNERRGIMGWEPSQEPLMNVEWVPAGLIPINESGITQEQIDGAQKRLGFDDYRG